jgi:hypothetical protein
MANPPHPTHDPRKQAQQVAYITRRAEGAELVAVVGDLNDTPDSQPLAPLT